MAYANIAAWVTPNVAIAYGANGGDGGDAQKFPGTGGSRGTGEAHGGKGSKQLDGYPGAKGKACSPSTPSTPVGTLKISPPAVWLDVGGREKFRATYTVNGQSTDVSAEAECEWESSDSRVASVHPGGHVFAHDTGVTSITATYRGVSTEKATVTVTARPGTGTAGFPPGNGRFTQNWSDGSKTPGDITFNADGSFTQTSDDGFFTANGIWTRDAATGDTVIIYSSYTLNGDTIAPQPGDQWHILSGNLDNGGGTLTAKDGSWSVGIAVP